MQRLKKYKICRRLGSAIFEKCQSQKFLRSLGETKKKSRFNVSTYGLQLLEKQKTQFSYGIRESQLAKYVKEVLKGGGQPAQKLYQKLETRLDNVIYRLGLAGTRRMARQLVSHGHFLVNGKKTRVPSYSLKVGDKIEVREGSRQASFFTNLDKKLKDYHLPDWLEFDINNLSGIIRSLPQVGQDNIDLNAVLEFYSR